MTESLHYGDFLYDLSLRKIREGVYDIRWSGGVLSGCCTCGSISVGWNSSHHNLHFAFGDVVLPEWWREEAEKVRAALAEAGLLARVTEELSLVLAWAEARGWADGVSDHDAEWLFVNEPFGSGSPFHFARP